jgi:FKBP-type peptidyl-prolyl cis-trans isomerase
MKLFIFLLFSIFLLSCAESEQKKSGTSKGIEEMKAPLLKANQHLVRNEDQLIEAYITRYQLTMAITKTGLRYSVQKSGSGKIIKAGDRIEIHYTLSLLDGTPGYSSEKDGPLVFTAGKGDVNSGLEEAILLMKEGEQAKIIVPSHLGFGLLGDGTRIPARSTLVYQINNIKVISR